jgi:hypothetical protein
MPCEHAEQPLSCSTLEDTGTPAPMEIMMAGSPEDICLLACSLQNPGIRGGPGAAPSQEGEPEPQGHVVAPELPRTGSPSRGDTWQPQSCPQPGGGSRCLDLKLVRGGTQSSGYQQWPLGPPRERMRTSGWGQHPFPMQPF